MFRKMLRSKQALSQEDCAQVLRQEMRGVLSVLGDDGYPYGMPMNYLYDETNGCLYFHGGRFGHKIDALRRCDKASFCVYDGGYRREGEWALNIRSVIVFGRLRPVTEEARAMDISRKLSYKFTADENYISEEILRAGPRTLGWEPIPEHITGKLVNES